MIPHPELLRFEVRPGDHMRAVMCSDGVWDLLTQEEVAAMARKSISAQAVADNIVATAVRRSKRKLNRLKDDTTCVCVDLNPSGVIVYSDRTTSGCCAVS